jgi:hypothetical protein
MAMSQCYERGIRFSEGVDTAFIFLTPDCLWADGSFRNMDVLQRRGKRAIMIVGLRACRPEVVAKIKSQHMDAAGTTATIPARDLVSLALQHLHPLSIAHICNGYGNRSIGHYYWELNGKGLLARCFHIHPLMVRPLVPGSRVVGTLDHDFVRLACPDYADVHVVVDSDEICGIELSERNHLSHMISPNNINDEALFDWIHEWTNHYHRCFVRERILFRTYEPPPDLETTLMKSDHFIKAMFEGYRRSHPSHDEEGMRMINKIQGNMLTAPHTIMGTSSALTAPAARRSSLKQRVRNAVRRLCKRLYRAIHYKLYARIEALESEVRYGPISHQFASLYYRLRSLDQQLVLGKQLSHNLRRDVQQKFDLLHTRDRRAGSSSHAALPPPAVLYTCPEQSVEYACGHADAETYRAAFATVIAYLNGTALSGHVCHLGKNNELHIRILCDLLGRHNYHTTILSADSARPGALNVSTGTKGHGESANDAATPSIAVGATALPSQPNGEPLKEFTRKESMPVLQYPLVNAGLQELPAGKCSLVHMHDCGEYEETKRWLDRLDELDLFQDGCVILFDNYNCNRANPSLGERRALREFMKDHPRWSCSAWLSYGWHGQAFFLHDNTLASCEADRASELDAA